MKLENMKDEFPQTPEFIKSMIKQEVEKQVNEDGNINILLKKEPGKNGKRKNMKKTAAIALIATMAFGTTVYAASRFYKMYTSSEGNYAVKTQIEQIEGTEDMEESAIPKVKMETTYLPENMTEQGDGKYGYMETPYEGGISMVFYRMDQGDDAFEVMDKNVLTSQEIQVSGHDGVYLELTAPDDGNISFDKRIYVSYPEVHYVMQMYVGSNVSKEEAIKTAEGVRLTAAADTETENIVSAEDWSSILEANKAMEGNGSDVLSGMRLKATAENMKNSHLAGDMFGLDYLNMDGREEVKVKVTDVEILDHINVLDEKYTDSQLKKETDQNGKLLPAVMSYIKKGNGIDSVDEVIAAREIPQKLVYVTAEYTNTSDRILEDILYFGSIIKIETNGNEFYIYQGEKPSENDEWDAVINSGYSAYGSEMPYSDVQGGSNQKNYISSLKAGETATVHMAFVVTEEELPYLYLNLDGFGGCYEFTDTGLETGYVDIRQ